MKATDIEFNFNRPGEVYFIREKDVITGEISKYIKIGLVGDRANANGTDAESGEAEEETETDLSDSDSGSETDADVDAKTFADYQLRSSLERLKEHQTGNPDILLFDSNDVPVVRCPAVAAAEKALHARFAKLRVRGEWFMLTDDQVKEAVALAQALAVEQEGFKKDLILATSLAGVDSTEEVIKPDSELQDFWDEQRLVEQSLKKLVHRASFIENEIAKQMSNAIELDGVAGWTFRRGYKRLNYKDLRANHPEFEPHFVGDRRSATLLVKGALKVETKNIDKIETTFSAETKALLSKAARPVDIEALHQEYLAMLKDINELNWKKTVGRATLKTKFGDAREIEGIATWVRKTDQVFQQGLVKPYLISIGRTDLIEKFNNLEVPDSYSFKVLPMRPYPTR